MIMLISIPMFLRLPLAITLFVLIVVVIWRGNNLLTRWNVAWKLLAEKFPVKEVHKLGVSYSRQDGYYNRRGSSESLNYMFRMEVAQEGLLVTAYFARHLPILIPWVDIQDIEEVDLTSKIRFTVNYEDERRMTFRLPKEALTVIQQNVPADRLHKTSFSQLLKSRLDHDAS